MEMIKILMSTLVGQKLEMLEAQRLFDIITEHSCSHFRRFAQLELVAMHINSGQLKFFGGRILCSKDNWAYNVETNEELEGKELNKVINLVFNEGAVRDYGN